MRNRAPEAEADDSSDLVRWKLEAGRLHLLHQRRAEARRARLRRRRLTAAAVGVLLASVLVLAGYSGRIGTAERRGDRPEPAAAPPPEGEAPIRRRIDEARAWSQDRPGLVSFAVVGREGRVRGEAEHRTYPSASVVKAMLLVAEAWRLADADLPLDPATESTLRAMITYSDNDAADAIYARVGDAGLQAVAERVGMEDFTVSGYWANAQISAHDMALLFGQLGRAFPEKHAKLGKGLLGSIIPDQSWGIPAALGKGWNVRFKGGWRSTDLGQLVHQAAEAKRGDRAHGLAVLTDRQPSMAAGIETVEGVARRLVGG